MKIKKFLRGIFSKFRSLYKKNKLNKKWYFLFFIPIVLVATVFIYNYISLQVPMNGVIKDDSRNDGIEIDVHYSNYLNTGILVFDLEEVSLNKSRADVFRVLLQYADAIQDKDFDEIHLSYNGDVRFTLSGFHFKTIGEEYDWQNAVYTMRTFPEKLKTPYGYDAFDTWTGGVLGVTSAQMEDFSEFHDEWYFDELL